MLRRAVPLLLAFGCLTAAPLLAQEPVSSSAPAPTVTQAGPRLQGGYPTYRPALAEEEKSGAAASAAAADRTIITISTLGLVLLVVLLIILIA